MSNSLRYQLVFRFRKATLPRSDDVRALEGALAEVLGDHAQMDGFDTGRRDVDLFIMTPEPAATFRRSKPALEQLELLDKVTVAHRLEGGARFTVLWPRGFGRQFKLP